MSDSVTMIRTVDGLAGAAPEWREFIANGARGASFDNDPVQIGLTLARDPKTSPWIVVVRRNSKLHCIAPFCNQPTCFRMRWSVFNVASFPARRLKLCGGELIRCSSANEQECWSLVFDSLAKHSRAFDLLFFENLRTDSELWKYCRSYGTTRRRRTMSLVQPDVSFQIKADSPFDDYLKTLGSKTRQNLRRVTRKFQTEHQAELTKVTRPDQVPSFLEQIDEVYSDSWQAKTHGPIIRNRPEQVRWLQGVANNHWLRSYVLCANNQPIAFQLGFQYSGVFFARDFAFAQKWAGISPGSVLMFLFLEHLFGENRPETIDLDSGDSPQKRSFGGIATDVAWTYLVPRSSGRWATVFRSQRLLDVLEGFVRRSLVKSGLDQRVRRFLKHKK